MQKIRKIFKTVSEKTALPTNQPIITNNTDFIGPGWRRSKKYQITFEITDWKTEKKMLIYKHSHSRFLYWNDILYKSEYLKRNRQA